MGHRVHTVVGLTSPQSCTWIAGDPGILMPQIIEIQEGKAVSQRGSEDRRGLELCHNRQSVPIPLLFSSLVSSHWLEICSHRWGSCECKCSHSKPSPNVCPEVSLLCEQAMPII